MLVLSSLPQRSITLFDLFVEIISVATLSSDKLLFEVSLLSIFTGCEVPHILHFKSFPDTFSFIKVHSTQVHDVSSEFIGVCLETDNACFSIIDGEDTSHKLWGQFLSGVTSDICLLTEDSFVSMDTDDFFLIKKLWIEPFTGTFFCRRTFFRLRCVCKEGCNFLLRCHPNHGIIGIH